MKRLRQISVRNAFPAAVEARLRRGPVSLPRPTSTATACIVAAPPRRPDGLPSCPRRATVPPPPSTLFRETAGLKSPYLALSSLPFPHSLPVVTNLTIPNNAAGPSEFPALPISGLFPDSVQSRSHSGPGLRAAISPTPFQISLTAPNEPREAKACRSLHATERSLPETARSQSPTPQGGAKTEAKTPAQKPLQETANAATTIVNATTARPKLAVGVVKMGDTPITPTSTRPT